MTQDPNGRAPLDFVTIDTALVDAELALEVQIEEATPSTNAVVAERARAGAPEGLVVVTEHQTAGRGRLDRTWQTPARSSLTFSVLLRPPAEVPAERWPWLPLLAGLAVSEALREQGYVAGVKWPNDVLLHTSPEGERKVCGILVERVEDAAVVGIGLNVSQSADELPVDTATSLALVGGREVDRSTLLGVLLTRLAGRYHDWVTDPDGLAAAYRAASVTLGRDVRAELPGGGELTGMAVDIDRHGRLVVRTAEGDRPVAAGDVIHVRPAPG